MIHIRRLIPVQTFAFLPERLAVIAFVDTISDSDVVNTINMDKMAKIVIVFSISCVILRKFSMSFLSGRFLMDKEVPSQSNVMFLMDTSHAMVSFISDAISFLFLAVLWDAIDISIDVSYQDIQEVFLSLECQYAKCLGDGAEVVLVMNGFLSFLMQSPFCFWLYYGMQ